MEKRMEKRAHKPQVFVHSPKKKFTKAHYTIAAVVLALVLIIAIVSVVRGKQDPVIATVNGLAVKASELKILKIILQPEAGVSDAMLLNDTLIPQTLLLQEAAKRGIKISDDELDSYVSDALKSSGTTVDSLQSNLKKAGIAYSDFREFVRSQMTIDALKVQIFTEAKLEVSEAEVKDFYEKNKAQIPAGATYESVKPTIINFLVQQKQNAFVMQYVEKLRSKATIVIK